MLRIKRYSLAVLLMALPVVLSADGTVPEYSSPRRGAHVSSSAGNVLHSSVGQIVIGYTQALPLEKGDPRLQPSGDELEIAANEEAPKAYTLERNYPNPFNPTTSIRFSLAEQTRVTLKIYDVAGRFVRTLVDETKSAGEIHTAVWDGRDDSGAPVSTGVYFYQLVAKNYTETQRMVLLK